ncbi:WYL domain-containing protein [Luteolibacter rhizosphaerae]|uniref:WYL domain-containing protein n=1 Tax=Luteolibacter rhizosphaerae TaxID=2989719 RepID=UPI0031F2F788
MKLHGKVNAPGTLGLVRAAVEASRELTIGYQGEILTVQPHALLQAPKTHAYVLVAWDPQAGDWGYFRFALIRGLKFESRAFVPKGRIPRAVPRGSTMKRAN